MLRFPQLLYRILEEAEDHGHEEIISWLSDGKRFKVHDIRRFAKEIMPRYFSHDRYKSFLRQLSLYQFKRGSWKSTPGPRGSYLHPAFQKGREDLLNTVRRTKSNFRASKYARMNDIGDCSSPDSSKYNEMDNSTSSSSFEKYLDPSPIVQTSLFSWDIVDEIVDTFGSKSCERQCKPAPSMGVIRATCGQPLIKYTSALHGMEQTFDNCIPQFPDYRDWY